MTDCWFGEGGYGIVSVLSVTFFVGGDVPFIEDETRVSPADIANHIHLSHPSISLMRGQQYKTADGNKAAVMHG